MTQLYTSSRLRVLRQCLRLHFYRYTLGLDGGQSNEMRFGTVAHSALEAYFRAWQSMPDIGDLRLSSAQSVVNESELGDFDRVKLFVLLAAYDARWGGCDWEILAVEQEFRYQLGDYLIGGKIDAIVRDRADGRIYVLEHKTTGADASLGSSYWEKLTIDTQVSIYVDGAAMLGHEIAGCIYDVLKRPAHEQKLATPEENRSYTQGKGCKLCGGKLTGGVQGSGRSPATQDGKCAACKGSGWRIDENGQPEAPRLHSNQRATDETVEQFEIRLTESIAESPDAFLLRGTVVRLDGELEPMRADLIETIKVERMADLMGVHPRNPDACARGNRMCSFFSLCCGQSSTNDFQKTRIHQELSDAA